MPSPTRADGISAGDWLAQMSTRLQQQWPTIDPTRLDDLALDLSRDQRLRAMAPREAADEWLRPVRKSADA
jgi:hypothetical protein